MVGEKMLSVSPFCKEDETQWVTMHGNRQGNVQTRTFEPTNESGDCCSAAHSYNFNIRVK